MPQAIPAIGSGVKFHRNHPAGEFDAIVIGYERPQDHDVDKDGLPLLTLIHMDPTKVSALGGAGWREAFVAVYSVPHENVNDEGPNHYSLTQEGTDAVLQAVADEGAVKPSAADLDAVADEDKAKEATKGNGKKAKPVAIGK